MPLALHRSLTFWSGLLIIAFLAWGWRDSERQWTRAGDNFLSVHSGWGGLILKRDVNAPTKLSSFEFVRQSVDAFYLHTPETFPAPFIIRARDVSEVEINELFDRLTPQDTKSPSATGVPTFTVREILKVSAVNGSPRTWLIFIPYWLLILLTALLTAALITWRARRRKRSQMTNAEIPNAE